MIKEVSHALPVLCALVIANIAAGTVNSIAIEKLQFDKKRMLEGVVKAIVAIAGIFALAYAFDTVDLSSLGFTPMTIVSAGIFTYGYKAAKNVIKLWGLTNYIKLPNNTDVDDSDKTE